MVQLFGAVPTLYQFREEDDLDSFAWNNFVLALQKAFFRWNAAVLHKVIKIVS